MIPNIDPPNPIKQKHKTLYIPIKPYENPKPKPWKTLNPQPPKRDA